MIRVAIVGATGYGGQELIKLLLRHPKVKITMLVSQSAKGKAIGDRFHYFNKLLDMKFEALDIKKIASNADLVFLSLPHKSAMKIAGKLLKKGLRVIDFSADFRLKDKKLYKLWYGIDHPDDDLLAHAVYGLPEFYRSKIKKAQLVANPGCYPTSVLLPVLPALVEGLILSEDIIIDSKSGTSGAGRMPSDALHFPECNESINAYKVGNHQHLPEIEQELTFFAKHDVEAIFMPHLIPMNRGILSTIYLKLRAEETAKEMLDFYREYYKKEYFVRILKKNEFPQTKNVDGLNFCDIGIHVDEDARRLVLISAIDNLIKGAAGQALQNMNIMCGYEETLGLV